MNPRIAIVVPTYGHPGLVNEAIRTSLHQDDNEGVVVIAVNDGCPLVETRRTLSGWASLRPDRVHVVHQSNLGLSGARNTGIAYARRNFPSLEAIFLLDADNRLQSHSVSLFKHLLDTDPEADWFFPNFDMFGLESAAHNGAPYSVARMANSNQCEAGSLVRMRVFEAGLAFDETMKSGYEDWDFWLSASEQGFRGRRIAQNFFCYRKRPESMLSGSHSDDTILRERIRRKHRWLYARDGVLSTVMEEGPLLLSINAESGDGALHFGPKLVQEALSPKAVEALLFRAVAQPQRHILPPFAAIGTVNGLKLLDDDRWGASIFTSLAQGAIASGGSALTIESSTDESVWIGRAPEKNRTEKLPIWQAFDDADIAMLRLRGLFWMLDARNAGQAFEELGGRINVRKLVARLPGYTPKEPGKSRLFKPWFDLKKRMLSCDLANNHRHRFRAWRADPAMTGPADLHAVLSENSIGGAPFPFARQANKRHVGFVLPILKFGGVEKCAIALARAIREEGGIPHLFIYGNEEAASTDWLFAPFETVHFVGHPGLRDWQGPRYLGTKMASKPPAELTASMLGPLSGMDAVVNAGAAALHYGLGELKRKGITTVSWEHLLETGPYGRIYGTPYLGIAHEGGYDLILTCSKALSSWMHGQGVPEEKLLPLPNGPGFPMDSTQVLGALEERRRYSGPLRVGFLGRMDRQKGLDRFLSIANQCRKLDAVFSITGKAVLDGEDLQIPTHIPVHPPAYGLEELRRAFAGIDVLLMPSRNEGLPLTIMEAQRVGVVPIVTQVGAVSEAIREGETGFIVPENNVVPAMSHLVRRLAEEHGLLESVSSRASSDEDQWSRNAKVLMKALQDKARP